MIAIFLLINKHACWFIRPFGTNCMSWTSRRGWRGGIWWRHFVKIKILFNLIKNKRKNLTYIFELYNTYEYSNNWMIHSNFYFVESFYLKYLICQIFLYEIYIIRLKFILRHEFFNTSREISVMSAFFITQLFVLFIWNLFCDTNFLI